MTTSVKHIAGHCHNYWGFCGMFQGDHFGKTLLLVIFTITGVSVGRFKVTTSVEHVAGHFRNYWGFCGVFQGGHFNKTSRETVAGIFSESV